MIPRSEPAETVILRAMLELLQDQKKCVLFVMQDDRRNNGLQITYPPAVSQIASDVFSRCDHKSRFNFREPLRSEVVAHLSLTTRAVFLNTSLQRLQRQPDLIVVGGRRLVVLVGVVAVVIVEALRGRRAAGVTVVKRLLLAVLAREASKTVQTTTTHHRRFTEQ